MNRPVLTVVGTAVRPDGVVRVMCEVAYRDQRWQFDATLARHHGATVVVALDQLRPVGDLPDGGLPTEVVRAIRPAAIVNMVLTNAPTGLRVMEPDGPDGDEVKGPDVGEQLAATARAGLGLPAHQYDDPVPPARRAADRRTYDDIDLARHALRVWRAWRSNPRSPNPVVAAEVNETPEWVRDQSKRAREQGFMLGQGRGKAGGVPTSRAVEVLRAAGELSDEEAAEVAAAHQVFQQPTKEEP